MLTTSLQELKSLNSCLRDEHCALQLAFASLEEKLRKVQVCFRLNRIGFSFHIYDFILIPMTGWKSNSSGPFNQIQSKRCGKTEWGKWKFLEVCTKLRQLHRTFISGCGSSASMIKCKRIGVVVIEQFACSFYPLLTLYLVGHCFGLNSWTSDGILGLFSTFGHYPLSNAHNQQKHSILTEVDGCPWFKIQLKTKNHSHCSCASLIPKLTKNVCRIDYIQYVHTQTHTIRCFYKINSISIQSLIQLQN